MQSEANRWYAHKLTCRVRATSMYVQNIADAHTDNPDNPEFQGWAGIDMEQAARGGQEYLDEGMCSCTCDKSASYVWHP